MLKIVSENFIHALLLFLSLFLKISRWVPLLFQLRGDTSFYYTGQFHFGLPVGFSLNFIVTNYVAYTYVAINPIICLIFSGNYLEALRRLVNCCDAVQD